MKENGFISQCRAHLQYRNARLTPRRKKFQLFGAIGLLIWSALTLTGGCFCLFSNFHRLWWLGLLFFFATICGVLFLIVLKHRMDRIEVLDELERLSYLFKNSKVDEDETLEVVDEEDAIRCLLSKQGIRVKSIQPDGQVFDEGVDDGKFFAWDDLEIALATSNEFFRICLGLAIMKKDITESADEDLFLILPMQKNLALAIHSFIWDKLGVDWLYLFYQPYDSFMQIMRKGRVQTYTDKATRKELTEEFCQAKNGETEE